ncbi:wall-associated receptor kinase 3-like [Rutidosis leptorrhynchoides]|uniref:wall-associated receptor kinase 3-like n=1 Tax=Rutidosis leptorrhynchoides TaxID=125765 RepID=UPI003A99B741
MRKLKQVVLFLSLAWHILSTSCQDLTGCEDKCGGTHVTYPFGIDEARCALSESFLLVCDRTKTGYPDQLMLWNVPVRNISIENGTVIVGIPRTFDCYDNPFHTMNLTLYGGSKEYGGGSKEYGTYMLSDTRNKLIGLGCATDVYMTDKEGNFGSGCYSLCNSSEIVELDTTCSSIGCCQIAIPKSMTTLNIRFYSLISDSSKQSSDPCGYGFLAEVNSFNLSKSSLSFSPEEMGERSDVALDWVVTQTYNSTICGNNATSFLSPNGQGYRCKCSQGFSGNPYLKEGCEDIDECKEPKTYYCEGSCKNTNGNYTCKCPLGMHGEGKVEGGCRGFRLTTTVTVVGAVIGCLVIVLLFFYIIKRRNRQKYFMENGGKLLNHQRVRIFSERELNKATNNYDKSNILGEGGFGIVYKGDLGNDVQVAIKKPKEVKREQLMNHEFQHEIEIVSQVNHKNAVKLLGLCLETKVPLLVYEFISNGTLFEHIHNKQPNNNLRNWKLRLRIAAETALALDYLHSLADPPIIHSDVKSTNILLDDNYMAKVSDFGASVLISPNHTALGTKIQGTLGYLDPEYLMTGILTEKSDVYSFGVVLVEILTGEKPAGGNGSQNIIQHFFNAMKNGNLSQILGFELADDSEIEEVEVVAELANECLNRSGMNRPTMRGVTEELARIKRSHENLCGPFNGEETEHLLGESSNIVSLDIEDYTYSI